MSAFSDDSDLDITKNIPHSMAKTKTSNVKKNDINTITYQKVEDVGKSFDNTRNNGMNNFSPDPLLLGSINMSSHIGSDGEAVIEVPRVANKSPPMRYTIGNSLNAKEATMREKA